MKLMYDSQGPMESSGNDRIHVIISDAVSGAQISSPHLKLETASKERQDTDTCESFR